jgi:prolyl oligopeptidase
MKRNPPIAGILGILAAATLAVPLPTPAAPKLAYPESPRVDVVDDFFGTPVADPWRWLEADFRTSDSVATWVDAQERLTRGYLDALPERPAFQSLLEELWATPQTTAPVERGGRWFYRHNDGRQDHAVLYVQESPDGEPRVLIDPNDLSDDRTTALTDWRPSPDGRHVAYGVSMGGTDWREWRVRNVDSGEDLPGVVRWVRYSNVSWNAAGDGFFYSRYPEPAEGTAYTGRNLRHRVCFHRIGTDAAEDVTIYDASDNPEWLVFAETTEDGRWLSMSLSLAGRRNRLWLLDLAKPGSEPIRVVDEFRADFDVIGSDGPTVYVRTNDGAPLGRIVAVNLAKPEPENWITIIPEGLTALRSAAMAGNFVFLTTMEDAASVVRQYDLNGHLVRTLDLPGLGTATVSPGLRTATELFYGYSSLTRPPTIFRMSLADGTTRPWRDQAAAFDPDAFDIRREFVTTADGARVPLFVAHRKGLERNGENPTLLYVYGGFNQPQVPAYSSGRAAWLRAGGVYVIVCARGGGEYGRDWHEAATKLHKQRTMDDVIAAGEYLVRERYTSPERLGLQGGSNGGMVVGAVANQRPDLFGAVIPQAGVMDMLRYHRFTVGRAWAADYGLAENPIEFKALFAYSPYHNVNPGTRYPAILVTTADHDDRVVPGHSFKYAAALQAAQAGEAPVLISISRSTGHTSSLKARTKSIADAADVLAFLAHHLDLEVSAP